MLQRLSLACGIFAALCLLGGLAAQGIHRLWTSPAAPQGEAVVFTVSPGDSFRDVVRRLAHAGLIRTPGLVALVGRIGGSNLRAGEFALSPTMSPQEILWTLRFGPPVRYRLTLPEGLTLEQTAQRAAATGLVSAEDFLTTCHDPDFIAALGIAASNLEGYLFPDTYFFERPAHADPKPLITAMVARFRQAVQGFPFPNDPKALHRTVILASIVEKETAQDHERPRVAGVYGNRLARGMLLQADPTVIYGLGASFAGELTRAHLHDPSNLYNTYVHPGLPPGPICSPGRASLLAAAAPEAHDYLYFVADGTGGHRFSRTLAEHLQAVRHYRSLSQERAPERPHDAPQEGDPPGAEQSSQ